MLDAVARRRPELPQGQHPHSIIVGLCSDSRVAPEIVFDQGLGELFVVRTAGNVVDFCGLGSLEYAVAHLEVPLVVILGHSSCGAVSAALEGAAEGYVESVLSEIEPAVAAIRGLTGDRLSLATRENAVRTAWRILDRSSILANRVRAGRLWILAAYNHLADGRVEFFTTAPSGLDLASHSCSPSGIFELNQAAPKAHLPTKGR